MNIGSVCTHDIVGLEATETLQRAAQLMREHHVGAVVVTETRADGTHVVGIVTDRDLAVEVLARGGDASQVPVSRLVKSLPVGVPAEGPLEQAIQTMQAAGVRRLLVHDAQGALVGLLSFDDLLPALVTPLAGLAEVLRRGFERENAERHAIAAATRPVLRVPAMGTAGWQQGPLGSS